MPGRTLPAWGRLTTGAVIGGAIREPKGARPPASRPPDVPPPAPRVPPMSWRSLKALADATGRETHWREAAAAQGERDVIVSVNGRPAVVRVVRPIL